MENKSLHDGMPPLLTIDNLASGAAYEMFNDALKKLAANLADPNTDSTQKRRITLNIVASPYKDRSGAELSVKVDTKLAGMRSVDGVMYIARRDGEYLAFGRNTKQTEIEFDMATVDHSGPTEAKKAN